jgi:uncharacterized damage-inducible protein DinB
MNLNRELIEQWQQLRSMLYDFLTVIQDNDLKKKLPFERSQSLANQFYCIQGTAETFVKYIQTGEWPGWKWSFTSEEEINLETLTDKLKVSERDIIKTLEQSKLLEGYEDSNKTPLSVYMTLVEHESHHQGQLINFIYALDLPIPKSWEDKWALTRD